MSTNKRVLLCFTFIFVLIIFIKYQLNTNIDWVIVLISNLGAIAVAIAAFLTINEMKEQRISSHLPHLVLSNHNFIYNPNSDGIKIIWENTSDNAIISTHGVQDRPALLLSNIGLGAAKQIQATLSYSLNDLINEVNAFVRLKNANLDIKIKNGWIHTEGLTNSILGVHGDISKHYNFIMPLSTNGESMLLELPYVYYRFISILFFLAAKDFYQTGTNIPDIAIPNIPELNIKISYCDIQDSKYDIFYKITMEILSFGLSSFSTVIKTTKSKN